MKTGTHAAPHTARRRIAAAVALFASVGLAALCALGTPAVAEETDAVDAAVEKPKLTNPYGIEGPYIEHIDEYPSMQPDEKNASNAAANEPYTYVDQFGFTIQPVPADPKGFNATYLNAENRGCLSCHYTIEDALMSMDTWHTQGAMGYPTQLTVSNCIGCHYTKVHGDQRPMSTDLHGLHNGSSAFIAMGGTCDSCHFVDEAGEFQMWDYVKYDQYRGITDLAAESGQISVSYDQGTLTPDDQIFFEGMRQGGNPDSWLTDDDNVDPSIAENWVLTIDGDVENPISMTVPELIEQFGTTTVVSKQNCLANGVGGAWIYQAEFTGIPFDAILDYVKPAEGALSAMTTSADDAYALNLPYRYFQDEGAMLVVGMNGHTLQPSQGYPLATCFPGTSSAYMIKQVEHITFSVEDTPMGKKPIGELVTNPKTGVALGMPNSAVLNYPDGVVLESTPGETVTFEGYADAWDEPISKVEFSLDHGATWTTIEMDEGYDIDRWVYWRLDVTPPEPGTYLLNIRTTSTMADGTERVCDRDTQFLFTVR